VTHDEMLAKIEDEASYQTLIQALTAVVEYTRPNEWDFTDEKYNKIEISKIIERHLK
jgi:hypothetical protein